MKKIVINNTEVDLDEFVIMSSVYKPQISLEITLHDKNKTKTLIFGVQGSPEEVENMKKIKEEILDYWCKNPPSF